VAKCAVTDVSEVAYIQLDTGEGKEAIRKGQLYPGMLVQIGTGADIDAVSDTVEISAVDYANARITLATQPTVDTTANHYVFRAGSGFNGGATASGSRSYEIDGIKRIVADAAPTSGSNTFGEIDPYTKTWWDNKRINVNAQLTLDDIQQGMNLVRLEGNAPTVMVTSLGIQREIYNLMEDQVRYVDPESMTYVKGYKTLEYGGMPIVSDIDAPYGHIYMIDESTLKVFSDQDWHFLDADGQTLRQKTDLDAFEAIMTRYMNLGVTKRSNHAVLYNVPVDPASGDAYADAPDLGI
jgi:hypothetical protein